ncbi:uncharacterized protein LOC129909486 [Episyrphus balteatus]|uniref:uncharacterized protein LOC129909486 n=1 Tax=Episyrphus balteatus TaxID=286459 RepID=UPI002485A3B1|nr:uncharacterized protein LOC129909486 [Episyrphus balteatus]
MIKEFLDPEEKAIFVENNEPSEDNIPLNIVPLSRSFAENEHAIDDGMEFEEQMNACEHDDTDSEEEEDATSVADMSTTYFTGYVAKSLLKKSKCEICKHFMIKTNNENKVYTKSEELIKCREFNNTTNGGLTTPTAQFIRNLDSSACQTFT